MLSAAVPGKAERQQEFLEYFRDPPDAMALLANGLKGKIQLPVLFYGLTGSALFLCLGLKRLTQQGREVGLLANRELALQITPFF